MNRKCRILVPIGCRSDEGLSKPIINRLIRSESFYVYSPKLYSPGKFMLTTIEIESLALDQWKPDIIFITGDRVEMTAWAAWAFHNNIPIAHYYGGVVNDPIVTYDDINRHCISLWSTLQFVESKIALMNIEFLFRVIHKEPDCELVGTTHMENIVLDYDYVPKGEYDLILINPTTLSVDGIELWKTERKEIIIGSNPDGKFPFIPTYENLPRNQFLGLLSKCTRFITNSSSAIYEAPYLLNPEQIRMVGDRNRNRLGEFYKHPKYLASELIVKKLKKWWSENGV